MYNGLLAGLSYIFLVVACMLGTQSFNLIFIGLTGFIFLSLVLLLSFHELFIYYLLQPFSSDMQVVNPAYRLINGAMYMFALFNNNITSVGVEYVVILGFGSFLYVIIGLFIIFKKASKTFKIH